MEKFYFTYGQSESFPFQDGWTEVYAENMGQAQALFRAVHPDKIPGILNCSFTYTEKQFEKGDIYKKGHNYGKACHEVIGRFESPRKILDKMLDLIKIVAAEKNKEMFEAGMGQYFGAISYARLINMISDEESDERLSKLYFELTGKDTLPKIKKCCFCGEPIPNTVHQHNATPIKDDICCLKCNITIVAPARAHFAKEGRKYD